MGGFKVGDKVRRGSSKGIVTFVDIHIIRVDWDQTNYHPVDRGPEYLTVVGASKLEIVR